MAVRAWDVGKSESRAVIAWIRVYTRHESEPTSDWSFFARKFGEPSLWGDANDDNGKAVDWCVLSLP
jgi:hypothetical protein